MRGDTPSSAPLLSAVAIVIAVITAVGLVLLRPTGERRPKVPALSSFEGFYTATTVGRTDGACAGTGGTQRCVTLRFRLVEGPDAGTTVSTELPADSARLSGVDVGRRVLLGHQPDVTGFEYVFLDPDRRFPLVLLAGLFVLAVIALGRWRGISALIGLVATLSVLFLFLVPAVLDGRDPLLVSLLGSVAIAFAALYLSHGPGTQTTVALFGTLGGLACATLLAVAFMGVAEITGAASEEALFLTALGTDIDLRGLILGGMMIGALGAIDDMTVTQAAAVWELRSLDPTVTRRRLLRSAMRIGRDHVASTVNTLVLAYAGASMPLLILFVLSAQSAGTVANGELVATEIVRTLVGSIGLVASVPITTWLAVAVVGGSGRHARSQTTGSGRPEVAEDEELPGLLGPPEEHPIPEHRRDAWLGQLRSRRAGRRR